MSGAALGLHVGLFGLALWLGLYLIARNPREPRLFWTGLGLGAYAGAIGLEVVAAFAEPSQRVVLTSLRRLLQALPALFWTGAIIYLLPEELPQRPTLLRVWRLRPVLAALFLLAPVSGLGATLGSLLAVVALLAMLGALWLLWRSVLIGPAGKSRVAVVVGTIFFGLSTALALLPFGWLPQGWAIALMGLDLLFLGLVVAVWDAFDQGETLLPDLVRSFDFSLFAALLFGGQVALAMRLATGVTLPMLTLLLVTIASAIATQTLADPLQMGLDKIALGRFPRLRQARADLRATASVLPRVNPALDPMALDEAEFVRLTRRAFSHFGDLSRLAASPLTALPVVDARLAERGGPDNPLERAIELKAVLVESIERLKPRGPADFGTSDEWRHYNALYFPYVVGLKPYSRRGGTEYLDPTARAALEWLQASVPERTLYNWQTTAARIVAQDLRRPADTRIPLAQR